MSGTADSRGLDAGESKDMEREKRLVHLRKMYYIMIDSVFILIYFVRYLAIKYAGSQIIFGGKIFHFDDKMIPYQKIIFFCILFHFFGLILPKEKKITIKNVFGSSSGWTAFFYLQNAVETMLYLVTGYTMGVQISSTAASLMMQIITLISTDMLYFFLLFQRKLSGKNSMDITCVYLIPYLIKGSKSGLFSVFLYYIVINTVLCAGKNIKKAVLYASGLVMLFFSYPYIYVASYYFKLGFMGKENFVLYVIENGRLFLQQNGGPAVSALNYLTRRINALDVLILRNQIENPDLFSFKTQISYFLKGIFTSSAVNKVMPGFTKSMGTEFANAAGMPEIGGMETTLFGNICFSKQPLMIVFLYICFFSLLFYIIRRLNNGILAVYLLTRVCWCFLTGTIQDLTYSLRTYIFICILNLMLSKINLPKRRCRYIIRI